MSHTYSHRHLDPEYSRTEDSEERPASHGQSRQRRYSGERRHSDRPSRSASPRRRDFRSPASRSHSQNRSPSSPRSTWHTHALSRSPLSASDSSPSGHCRQLRRPRSLSPLPLQRSPSPLSTDSVHHAMHSKPVRLWVGSLVPGTTARDIAGLLARKGVATLDVSLFTRYEPSYAFITVPSSLDASHCLNRLAGAYLHGRRIRIDRVARVRGDSTDPRIVIHGLPSSYTSVDVLHLAKEHVNDPHSAHCESVPGGRAMGSFRVKGTSRAQVAVRKLERTLARFDGIEVEWDYGEMRDVDDFSAYAPVSSASPSSFRPRLPCAFGDEGSTSQRAPLPVDRRSRPPATSPRAPTHQRYRRATPPPLPAVPWSSDRPRYRQPSPPAPPRPNSFRRCGYPYPSFGASRDRRDAQDGPSRRYGERGDHAPRGTAADEWEAARYGHRRERDERGSLYDGDARGERYGWRGAWR